MISREEKFSSSPPLELCEVAGGPLVLGQVAIIFLLTVCSHKHIVGVEILLTPHKKHSQKLCLFVITWVINSFLM